MRRLGIAALIAACTCASEPPVRQVGVLDGKEPSVRVWLKSLGAAEGLTVEGKGGLRVRTRGGASMHDGAVRVGRFASGTTFEPIEGIVTVGGKHAYSGSLEWRQGRLVNRVKLENYTLGVLRGELPLKKVPRAAAEAQAIAVRSYTLFYLAKDKPGYDVDDSTLFQRYVGLRYAPDDDRLRAGVQGTAGLYLAADGKPLKAYYHSTCGGRTTDERSALGRNDAPSIRGVPCEWCRASKYWRWKARLEDGAILKAAGVAGPLRSLEVEREAPAARADVFVVSAKRRTSRPAGEFRLAVGPSRLRSTRVLELTRAEGGYVVAGGGWGHGVGLCQMGAIGQGLEGRSGKEIAAYYYPAATIERAY